MNSTELNSVRNALRKQLHELDRITIACQSCLHLGAGRVCQHFNATPPPEWLRGPIDCAHWEHDNVPF
jgi:hypothetical protein